MMGDRVSIEFQSKGFGNMKLKSPVLFSHSGGMDFVTEAKLYAKALAKRKKGKSMMPLDRLEAQTVMVDFIREITKGMKEIEGGLYLGRTPEDGDNSDNGHHIIKLGKVI
jgi:hypothetical protein